MKKLILIALPFSFLLLESCSKCYECTRKIPVEVDKDNDGVNEIEFIDDTEDFCTSNRDEVDSKEREGFSCS
jgi:hypothetical protein